MSKRKYMLRMKLSVGDNEDCWYIPKKFGKPGS